MGDIASMMCSMQRNRNSDDRRIALENKIATLTAKNNRLSDWSRGALDDLTKERDAGGTCDHWILDLIETYPPDADEEVTP